MVKNDGSLTIVEVFPGACGFVTLVKARKIASGKVVIELESQCESVAALDTEATGPFTLRDLLQTDRSRNRILVEVTKAVQHASCPVPIAMIKAGEVALGLNVPASVRIEFKNDDGE
ncbi:MAG: hypothetical protein V1792_22085 [Pseudomonadota bacterium]